MDTSFSNLEWRKKGHQLIGRPNRRGEAATGAKLTEAAVIELRELYSYGATIDDVAEKYGISRSTAHLAINGTTWAHVPGALALRKAGEIAFGTRNGSCKIDEFDVIEIRNLARTGMGYRRISRLFGIHRSTVRAIVLRKIWRHVDDENRPIPDGKSILRRPGPDQSVAAWILTLPLGDLIDLHSAVEAEIARLEAERGE